MFPYGDSRLTRYGLAVFFLILVGYGYFEARGILFGPRIYANDALTVSREQYIRVKGTTDHIASITMNGTSISVTESGEFDEPFLLAPGSNRIILTAKDKYGNSTSKNLDIFYSKPASETAATSTSIISATSTVRSTSTNAR